MSYSGQASDQQFSTLVYNDLPQGGAIYRFTNLERSLPFNGASISSVQITSNVLTAQATNTFTAGQFVELSNMTSPNNFLNGALVLITSASGSQFTANYVHANFGPSAEANGFVLIAQRYITLGILSQEDPSVTGNYSTTACQAVTAIPTASDLI